MWIVYLYILYAKKTSSLTATVYQGPFHCRGTLITKSKRLSHSYNRSKLNTKCGRSPRFGRPSRSGDTGCWQNNLLAWRLRCLSRPGAHTSHHHEPAVNWSMAGGTCHPFNKPYEITAALLESSCATASSPVYLNWSAPHMSSRTSWKIRSSTLN